MGSKLNEILECDNSAKAIAEQNLSARGADYFNLHSWAFVGNGELTFPPFNCTTVTHLNVTVS